MECVGSYEAHAPSHRRNPKQRHEEALPRDRDRALAPPKDALDDLRREEAGAVEYDVVEEPGAPRAQQGQPRGLVQRHGAVDIGGGMRGSAQCGSIVSLCCVACRHRRIDALPFPERPVRAVVSGSL